MVFIGLFVALSACSGAASPAVSPPDARTESRRDPATPTADATAVTAAPDQQRIVAMAISDGVIGFERSYALTRQVGISATSIHLPWDEIESAPGVFDPDPNFASIAGDFYAGEAVSLSVTIVVLDTTTDRRPADLRGRPFDDAESIERFNALISWLGESLGAVTVDSLAIGNEVDVLLSGTGEWDSYARFFEATAAHARAVFPGVPVGVKTTLDGSRGPFADRVRSLHLNADAVMVTHYLIDDSTTAEPPDHVAAVFDDALAILAGRPVMFAELGYPSHPLLEASELLQAEFVTETFRSWDRHPEVALVMFTWSSDIGADASAGYGEYYGIDDERFAAYLASIGFIGENGEPKLAYDRLQAEIASRGW